MGTLRMASYQFILSNVLLLPCIFLAVSGRIPYIINGSTAEECAWPWQGRVRVRGSFNCGAVLIGQRHAITAAHCVHYWQAGYPVTVEFGVHDNSLPAPISRDAVKVHFAPDGEDLSVVELSAPVSAS